MYIDYKTRTIGRPDLANFSDLELEFGISVDQAVLKLDLDA